MSLLAQVQSGLQVVPRRVMIYGTQGIGKSTMGAMAPKPIFLQTEDGLAGIECDRFPLAKSFTDVMQALAELYSAEHAYLTVVIDSLDWLERLIHAEICEKRQVENIEDIGYSKGYVFALKQWRDVLDGLDALRNERGMGVVLIAHARIERFENPGNGVLRPLCSPAQQARIEPDPGMVRRGAIRDLSRAHPPQR